MTTSQTTDIVTPKTGKPLSTSSAIFKWRSLKTRVTLTTLVFFRDPITTDAEVIIAESLRNVMNSPCALKAGRRNKT